MNDSLELFDIANEDKGIIRWREANVSATKVIPGEIIKF